MAEKPVERDKVPRVQLPEFEGTNRFVQLRIGGEPYLVCGGRFHKIILADTLEKMGINFDHSREDSTLPKRRGDDYEVMGMGMVVKNSERVAFFGSSIDYGLEPNAEEIGLLKPYFPKEIEKIECGGRVI
jgi:hypothetical protein